MESPSKRPTLFRHSCSAVWPSTRTLGVGTALVAYVLATAIELNAKAACRAVVVAPLDASAHAWWERLGFHPFHPDDPTDTDLNLLTSEIQATLEPLAE